MALVVFTGGARSGKSTAAQDLARRQASRGARVVVAVFGRPGGDDEMSARIGRHAAGRPDEFETLVARDSRAWLKAVDADVLLIVDCLGTLLGLAMEEVWRDQGFGTLADADAEMLPEGVAASLEARAEEIAAALLSRRGDTIVVTNEVGDGVVPAYATGRAFRDLLGATNRYLVSEADAAYLCVAGRLIELTKLQRRAHWPAD